MTTEERLEKVERELSCAHRHNRRMMIGAAACLSMIVAWAFFAHPGKLDSAQAEDPTIPPDPKEVRAGRFILEDKNGKTRAELGVDKDEPRLDLYDQNGKIRAVLLINQDGPGLDLYDATKGSHAGLSVDKDGPSLYLSNVISKSTGHLSVDKDGPSLLLAEKGKVRAGLSVFENEPNLRLYDSKGKTIWKAP